MRLENGDLEWTVDDHIPPLRVDVYLKMRLPSYARAALSRYIRDGGVRRRSLAGDLEQIRPATRVHPGDVLVLRRPEAPPRDHLLAPRKELQVLFEDEWLAVVDKPAGMLVHPAGPRMDGTVIGILRERFGDRVDLAHRLDRETSGVLVVSRSLEVTRRLKADFKNRRVKKVYMAITRGAPSWETLTVSSPIRQGTTEVRVRQVVASDGAVARTAFQVMERLAGRAALVKASPETGRLHQIRVHLEDAGFPIFADKIYGRDSGVFLDFYEHGLTPGLLSTLGHWRHALHAQEICFRHPVTAHEVRVEAPFPDDLEALAAWLRAGDPVAPSSEDVDTRVG